jgi:molybdopterin-containing oxidoreductase family membrane subunit
MVLTIAIPLRAALDLRNVITLRHMENAAKVMLAAGMVVAYCYVAEFFFAWYSGDPYERTVAWSRLAGPYAPAFFVTLACNVGVLQLLWFRAVRRNMPLLFTVAILVNVGMWLERFVITVSGPARDFLPASWDTATLTWLDFGLLFGSIGTFFALMFLFVRVLPAITIFEVAELAHEEGKA